MRAFALLIAAAVVAADRITKGMVQHSLTIFDSIPLIPGWLRIVHTENPGAAFGMLAEGNPMLRSIVLIGVSSLVLAFVLASLWNGSETAQTALSRLALSFILGGAFGNLYDRVLYHRVTDFIEVYHGTWSFPAFNLADSAITVGAVLLVVELLRPRTVRVIGSHHPNVS